MQRKTVFAASILSSNFANLEGEIKKCEDAGIDRIHLDVMDGHFVPNITIGPVVVASIREVTNLPLDVHLMIETPGNYIDQFIDAGADLITFHVEEYRGKNSPPPKEGIYPRTAVDMDEEGSWPLPYCDGRNHSNHQAPKKTSKLLKIDDS